jgi:alcohol dehydrogenase
LALGAHVYIDNREEDAAARLRAMGGAQAVVTMIDHADTVSALLGGLAPEGRLVVLNAGKAPLPVAAGLLVGGQRSILGSITGTPCDSEKALNFSVLVNVRPQIEVVPLELAGEAYRKLKTGDVRYRMVLTMGGPR